MTASNDMVVTGRPGYFAGYFPGYSKIGSKFPNSWTWPVSTFPFKNQLVWKAHLILGPESPHSKPSGERYTSH
jgi:hypothetical protein